MESIIQKLKKLDAYPKVNEDFYSRSFSGGLITLVSSLVTLFLFLSEFRLYLHTITETQLFVDTSRGETLQINFDVTFPAIPCSLLSLDAMDIMGEQHIDIIEKPLQKHGGRLEHNEVYCGSCYGAEVSDDQCCNTCEDVRYAYWKKGWALLSGDLIDQCTREGFFQKVKDEAGEGCNIYGSLEVNKVAGNFHFAPGKSFHHSNVRLDDLLSVQSYTYNISHRINRLAFGDYFPGVVNPLDGGRWLHRFDEEGTQQYFLKVVPTIYTDIRGHVVRSNQYSVTEHFKKQEFIHRDTPGVFFFYDFSPIKFVQYHVWRLGYWFLSSDEFCLILENWC
ncbi:hypothetical protein JCGZ_20195 [Jatropha curcas]|uniref:Endoplasmic reticulum vesicle transporter C-terminal domain-containing protein n=1 Tax=Jatropha curcas TaxID=180498 RepID=A0A067JTS8_JATCU|nr:hypothetical protein JCGZ_20195 [Jatropha curcas]